MQTFTLPFSAVYRLLDCRLCFRKSKSKFLLKYERYKMKMTLQRPCPLTKIFVFFIVYVRRSAQKAWVGFLVRLFSLFLWTLKAFRSNTLHGRLTLVLLLHPFFEFSSCQIRIGHFFENKEDLFNFLLLLVNHECDGWLSEAIYERFWWRTNKEGKKEETTRCKTTKKYQVCVFYLI